LVARRDKHQVVLDGGETGNKLAGLPAAQRPREEGVKGEVTYGCGLDGA
jgi:hypothetical protein